MVKAFLTDIGGELASCLRFSPFRVRVVMLGKDRNRQIINIETRTHEVQCTEEKKIVRHACEIIGGFERCDKNSCL